MYIVEEMGCFDVGFGMDGSVVVGCMADSSVRLLDWRQVRPPPPHTTHTHTTHTHTHTQSRKSLPLLYTPPPPICCVSICTFIPDIFVRVFYFCTSKASGQWRRPYTPHHRFDTSVFVLLYPYLHFCTSNWRQVSKLMRQYL
jgi:hypothetical protein